MKKDKITNLKKEILRFKKDLKSGAYKKYKTIEEIMGFKISALLLDKQKKTS